ncbi:MAG: DUF1553 domain-containing protein [Acidobacteriota bacterium]|nr:DUF1553 domain-containing protein [Acidobacteriota bacterium]
MKTIIISGLCLCLLSSAIFAGNGRDAVDNFLEARQARAAKKKPSPAAPFLVPVDDLTFLRRAWLDLAGVIPDAAVIEQWTAQPSPWNREAIVDQILASDEYVSRWTNFLDELLDSEVFFNQAKVRNAQHDALRRAITENTPWDELFRQIIGFKGVIGEPGSFFTTHVEAGKNALNRQDFLDDQAASFTRKFLGIKTNCISCHNGQYHLEDVNVDLAKRKRSEFWGLAAFLSKNGLYCKGDCTDDDGNTYLWRYDIVDADDADFTGETFRIFTFFGLFGDGEYLAETETGDGMRPARNGGIIQPFYPFTGESPLPGETRRTALARIMTADRQFARNMVNRIWLQLIGRTFVEPVDEFDLARLNETVAAENGATVQPNDPELLEMVTDLFIDSGFDFKQLLRYITNSKTYQLDYAKYAEPDQGLGPYWGGASRVRRLQAESILQNLFRVTGGAPGMLASGWENRIIRSFWDLPGGEPGYIYFPDISDETMRELGHEDLGDLFETQERMSDWLDIFGRGDPRAGRQRSDNLDHTASLALMNDPAVLYDVLYNSPLVKQYAEALTAGEIDTEQLVNAFYLRTLQRRPSPLELRKCTEHFQGRQPWQSAVDVLWALVNHPDFLFR